MSLILLSTILEFVEERSITVVSYTAIDEYREEGLAIVVSSIGEENIQGYYNEESFTIISVGSTEEYWHQIEEQTFTVVGVLGTEEYWEEVSLTAVVVCAEVEHWEEPQVTIVGEVTCTNGFIITDNLVTIKGIVSEEDSFGNIEICQVNIIGLLSADENREECPFTIISEVQGADGFFDEQQITIVSVVSGEDYFYEELQVTIGSSTDEEDYYYEEMLVTITCVVDELDAVSAGIEEQLVTVVSVVYADELAEELQVTIVSDLSEIDLQDYYEEQGLIGVIFTKSSVLDQFAPAVKGRHPRPGETAVTINQNVSFYICSGGFGGDGVDISTVRVEINGVEYEASDPEFSYSGNPDQYYVEVGHPNWNYEQAVDVVVNASSLCGKVMSAEAYSFEAEWESIKTRGGEGTIELYEVSNYDCDILTIEEDWVRQGVERYTAELEVWWGRYQKLPYIENLAMSIGAGITNSRGKEILDNGYLSIKVGDGEYVQMYPDTQIALGPMFTHTKKNIFLKLFVPVGAETIRYFVLDLNFDPCVFFPYGRFGYGIGIYSNFGNIVDLRKNDHIYRAYVFNEAMWSNLVSVGIVASPFWRGDDKQW